MSKKNKSEIKLIFDSNDLRAAMMLFFDTYKGNLSPFLKDALAKGGINSDPAVSIKENEIVFNMVNTNKGAVLVYSDDKQNNFKSMDYKLVPNDTAYIKYETNQLVIFFKRGGEADETIAVFPDLEVAINGLKTVEDPREIQKRIAEIDARDADQNEKVLADVEATRKKRGINLSKVEDVEVVDAEVVETADEDESKLADKDLKAEMKIVK